MKPMLAVLTAAMLALGGCDRKPTDIPKPKTGERVTDVDKLPAPIQPGARALNNASRLSDDMQKSADERNRQMERESR